MIKWCTIKLFSSGPHGSECRFEPPPPECVFTRLDLSAEESWAPLELVWDCGSKGLQAGVAAPPRRSSTSARHPPTWLPQPSAAYENSRPCFSFSSSFTAALTGFLTERAHFIHTDDPKLWSGLWMEKLLELSLVMLTMMFAASLLSFGKKKKHAC